jgi:hypothetical protein
MGRIWASGACTIKQAAHYLLLVGSKVGVALMAGRSRDLLAGRPYRVVMRVLAVLLGFFALLLFREGLRHLAVI